MQRGRLFVSLPLVGLLAATSACGSSSGDNGETEGFKQLEDAGVDSIAFITRARRLGMGNVFDYTSFSVDPKSANIMRMGTVSGGAEATPITPFGTGDWPKADIMAMDVSFDGEEIVFSARLEGDGNYNIYRIKIDGSNPEEPGEMGPALIHSGPYHSIYPIYLPNDVIFFMTNETPEGVRQFRDEYQRGVTAQAATINVHGGNLQLGPRNLSHRVFPTLVSLDDNQGQILHTNWDHLESVNEGNLMVMNPDMTGSAEFYGKEGNGVSNSYLKARQVNDNQFLAISTARERTFQSGAIILVDRNQNEATSSAEILTPDVPRGREISYDRIGRYYDAYPLTDENQNLTHVLTSWANGPVQTDAAAGGVNEEGVDYGEGAGPPDFGIYVLDPSTGKRAPIYNDPEMWDVLPIAIGKKRNVPTSPAGATADTPDGTSLIGALNVLESSLSSVPDSGVYRVRIIEGFSTEEGVPGDFGMTMADGAILLGEAPVQWQTDNSFAAFVPEDRPIHVQLLDQFGMQVVNEDRWFSSGAGEQRMCGGCHEERGATSTVDPGLSDAVGIGPSNFGLAYTDRRLAYPADASYADLAAKVIWPDDNPDVDRLRGLPWDMGVQQAFDNAGCATCHDGTPGPANPGVIIRDTMSEDAQEVTWYFNLSGERVTWEYGMMAGDYTASHISALMMSGMMTEEGIEVEMVDPAQPFQSYIVPESASSSILVRYIQPEKVFPEHDPNVVAFADVMKATGDQPYELQHPNENTPGFDPAVHRPLTEAEKYLIILSADMGGQFYSLENAPGQLDEWDDGSENP